ncbi:hypothetical protein [Lactiplantibacillus fabifermentans]|uniref:Extracellular protein n=2 Tax=Lactiplantibacillus fabifermentans TaxID=483011 RepID=A0A0R2NL48_9LACO|nr:hypothetical protein [Lactiplantibacillus fabifermentans]ETY74992.1 hypothetical protein LFAB_04115 [Lactiplantibacillus fabifermentans T30PCM01]KRO26456.1 hypothetical protein DY78_GL000949 [Lactiplantibacillus fabifermentans DSM 21115]
MHKKRWGIGIALILVVGLGTYFYWHYQSTKTTLVDGTNTSAVIASDKEFYQTLIKKYPKLKTTLDQDEKPETYVIPGLVSTKSVKTSSKATGISKDMDPQGLAVTDKYVIISAYSRDKKYNSVLYFLNKKTGTFVKQIVLPNTSHVGGLAYDTVSKRLWVTTEAGTTTATLSAYDAKTLTSANFEKTHTTTKFDHVITLPNVKRASFITYHNNALYVGYFNLTNQGKFLSYPLKDSGMPDVTSVKNTDLRGSDIYQGSYKTNKRLQGVAFFKGQILFSQSYGTKDSKLLTFDNDGQKSWINFDNDDILKEVALPPYLEQIVVDGGNLYALFESGAKAYRNDKSTFHSDRVIKLNLTPLLK